MQHGERGEIRRLDTAQQCSCVPISSSGVRWCVVDRMIVLRDVLFQARALARLRCVIVLLAMLEQSILSGIVVTCDLRRVV